MRVSEYYSLDAAQPTLDFVDVDVVGDDRLFVDPRALRMLRTEWTAECVFLLQDFFSTVIDAIRNDRTNDARALLRQLREPNETHLGLSRGVARGRALGPRSARDVADALIDSEAIRTGLLEDLEETVLMVPGIAYDKVSDIATNVIRGPLIEFTQAQASEHGLESEQVDSGPVWNPSLHEWEHGYAELPTPNGRKLLLVPKVIVRKKLHYNADDYFRNYILDFLMEVELARPNSELVHLLKDGTPKITKKDLRAKYGEGKSAAVRITRQHPEVLARYRDAKRGRGPRPLDHADLAEELGVPEPDWDRLVASVRRIRPGRRGADAYHRAAEALLRALFHPDLALPEREVSLHQGRKRIDLTFVNQAQAGFFSWVGQHHPASYVIAECKNYSGDPANPELDQLSGRFSPSRGKFGLLLCRRIANKDVFRARCRDTAVDDRGFILALDDEDLFELVDARQTEGRAAVTRLLKTHWDALVM